MYRALTKRAPEAGKNFSNPWPRGAASHFVPIKADYGVHGGERNNKRAAARNGETRVTRARLGAREHRERN